MRNGRGKRQLGSCLFLTLTIALPRATLAQSDSATLHVTLTGWAERTWFLLTDPGAGEGGLLGDRGILQRFHGDIDAEYQLDLISSRFSMTQEFSWQQQNNGLRYWAGSINYVQLVDGVEIKAGTMLGKKWSLHSEYYRETKPSIDRDLLTVRVMRAGPRGLHFFAEGSLQPLKPDADMTLGGGWSGHVGNAGLSFTLLDAFSDLVYQVLEVWPGFAETAIDYERQPLAVRGSFDLTPVSQLRLAADAGILLQSRMRAYNQLAPDSGFRQQQHYLHAGALVEISLNPTFRGGVFGTYVRAVTDRAALPSGVASDDFILREKAAQLGAVGLADLGPRWRLETWLAHEWRPETREYRADLTPDVDYEDRAWSGSALINYRAPSGFGAAMAFEMDMRHVIKGAGTVPSLQPLGHNNARVRLDGGWRFGEHFAVQLGVNADLDGDTSDHRKRFDGAHGRFVMLW